MVEFNNKHLVSLGKRGMSSFCTKILLGIDLNRNVTNLNAKYKKRDSVTVIFEK